jgi:hypothetical protein
LLLPKTAAIIPAAAFGARNAAFAAAFAASRGRLRPAVARKK